MKIFGLIGKKLGHSFSKKYFEEKFKNLGVDASYLNFELDEIAEIKNVFTQNNLTGLNVTIPYKSAVIPFLNEVDEKAKNTGAVNCIKIKNGKTKGYNTDCFGFEQLLKPFLESQHQRAIILGTGGVSKAVQIVLNELGIEFILISRSPQYENEFSYEDINEMMMKNCKLMIQTTPVGMYPNIDNAPEIPYKYFTSEHLAVDLIYNPEETAFMHNAKSFGATTINGMTMLHQQAEKSWQIWNDDMF
ncbi:MAG: shikimate dehydrogenase [Crocinitomicaceae bacterium]|nr:shikimate dehydrogenase [Crocinitomicaceae bacterium]MBK8925807.1 shikimate dehydrogenase [Crocinitomicaceae bacterium]